MKKKWFVLIIAAIVVALVLVGCSRKAAIGQVVSAENEMTTEIAIPLEYLELGNKQIDLKDFEYSVGDDGVTITGYTGGSTDVVIPSSIEGRPVIAIGYKAFIGNGLTSINIPDSVRIIGDDAFCGFFRYDRNRLTNVTIPNSVIAIGNSAFCCNYLTNVIIGNSVKTIGDGAFEQNHINSITIPESVITIGNNAFSGNKLTNVIIGNSVKTIGYWAFGGNELTNVIIPDSVETMYSCSFGGGGNPIDNIIIPNSVKITERQPIGQ